jgi:predicted PurR-regulated permease PerM
MEGTQFRKVFLLLLVTAVTVLFVRMVQSFLLTILLAAIFTALLAPSYRLLLRLFRGRRRLASATCTLLFCVLILAPLLGFLGLVASQAVSVSARVAPWVEQQFQEPSELLERLSALPGIDRLEPYHDEILARLGNAVASLGQYLFQGLSSTTRGTVNFLFQFFLFLYALFFFLLDGERYLQRMLQYMPLTHEQEMRMLEKFTSVTKATIKGTLLVGFLQGALAGVALGMAGVDGWVFWSAVMMLLSVIPGLGVALVWFPAAIYLFAVDRVVAAILVAVWCAVVVGSIDNVLRPRLVGRDTRMPDLLILFSTLGGLMLFGLVGFLIGPIVAAIFVTLWDIYGVVFADALPPVGSLRRTSDD